MIDKNISDKTQVCIIGGGPAGVICGYLFALRGVSVVLLEGMKDFNREFRGDTLHASSLEILQQMGIVDEILNQSFSRITQFRLSFSKTELTLADFSAMDTRYPYVAIIPQEKFLNNIIEKAKQLACFKVYMGAHVIELKEDEGKVTGVKFSLDGNRHEINADLTIGADGRASTARRLAMIDLIRTSPPMDVLWFKLPLSSKSTKLDVNGRIGSGTMIVIINRMEYLQIGYIILKGDFKKLRQQGIEHFQDEVKMLAPELVDVVCELKDWSQVAILSVVTGRAERWFKDGLLLIGDAAHVMSPVGGVGINYAIQDAVATVNLLAGPVMGGRVTTSDLARVQKRREPAVSIIQGFQSLVQNRLIKDALKSDEPFSPPLVMKIMSKIPYVRKLLARFLAYGIRHEKIRTA